MQWEYNPKNYTGITYEVIPPGDYRVRIENAEEAVSKNTGKDMIKLTIKVSGHNSKIWYYLVLDNSDLEAKARTDNSLGQIFNSFNIAEGNFNLSSWVGKVGGATIKNRPDNRDPEKMQANIAWFIRREKQENLPAWQENAVRNVVTTDNVIQPEMADLENDKPPF